MTLVWVIDGKAPAIESNRSRCLPFGPHPELLRIAFGGVDSPGRADAQRLVAEQLRGFTRLFLFTWLENPDEEGEPDVCLADLWIEGDASDEAPPTGLVAQDIVAGGGDEIGVEADEDEDEDADVDEEDDQDQDQDEGEEGEKARDDDEDGDDHGRDYEESSDEDGNA